MTNKIRTNRKPLILARLLERDGDVCWYCSHRIDMTLRAPEEERATIDHLVPRSRGGANALENLRLAHWSCNNRRGSKLPRPGRKDLK